MPLVTDLKAYYKLEETSGIRRDRWGGHFELDTNRTLTDELFGYWTLDEASGTREDETTDRFAVDRTKKMSESLVAYWKLEETSGTRFDSKGSNHLTDNNTVTQADGKRGKSAQFVAANVEYLQIADNASLSTGEIDFTICAWVYLDSTGTTRVIASKGDNTGGKDEWQLRVSGSLNKFQFLVKDLIDASEFVTADSFGTLSTGVWYFVVGWHDETANTINIQVNGGAVDSVTKTLTISDLTGPFNIGSLGVAGPWDGRIDEVGFWKRVLTERERKDLYLASRGNTYLPGSNLTDNNTVTQNQGTKVKAAQFTMANIEYLSVADNADLSVGDIDFTFAGWIYFDNVSVTSGMLSKAGVAPNREYDLFETDLDGDQTKRRFKWRVFASDGTFVTVNSTVLLANATWYFVVAWHDSVANTINLQINNGIIESTATAGLVPNDGTAPFELGRTNNQDSQTLDGRIDEVGFWKRLLTAKEREDLYNSGLGNSYTRKKDLTDNNTVTFNPGKVGSAGQFTAANAEYLSRADITPLRPGTVPFSLACWVYFDSVSNGQTMVAKFGSGGASAVEYFLQTATDLGPILFQFGTRGAPTNDSDLNYVSTGAIQIGRWYFVVAWHDPDADLLSMQVDNGPVETAFHDDSINSTASAFAIGINPAFPTTPNAMNGRIDEVGFWKRVLTEDERSILYNAGRGNTITEPLAGVLQLALD